MLRKGKHAQSLGHCGPRPRAVEISRKIPSRMFLYIPSRVIWKDTGLMEKLPLSLNTCATLQKKKKKKKEARETETLTFTTAHSFKQPICQTRLNITAGTTVFSFLVFDFKWNDSFLIVCHNPKSVVSDFNSKWTHTHTRAHAHTPAHMSEQMSTCTRAYSRVHVGVGGCPSFVSLIRQSANSGGGRPEELLFAQRGEKFWNYLWTLLNEGGPCFWHPSAFLTSFFKVNFPRLVTPLMAFLHWTISSLPLKPCPPLNFHTVNF